MMILESGPPCGFNTKTQVILHNDLFVRRIVVNRQKCRSIHALTVLFYEGKSGEGQRQTGPPGCLSLASWAGWSAGQVGRHVKMLQEGVERRRGPSSPKSCMERKQKLA